MQQEVWGISIDSYKICVWTVNIGMRLNCSYNRAIAQKFLQFILHNPKRCLKLEHSTKKCASTQPTLSRIGMMMMNLMNQKLSIFCNSPHHTYSSTHFLKDAIYLLFFHKSERFRLIISISIEESRAPPSRVDLKNDSTKFYHFFGIS